jgi:molybdopterin adenylyltransferase
MLMPVAIRTGILYVPRLDEDAGRSVATLLQQLSGSVLILMEQSVASQRNLVEERLRKWCDEDELDLLITVGGTYPAPGPGFAEIVPEATRAVIERLLPGLAETMRSTVVEETLYALLDRSITGIRGRTLIINLPAGEVAATFFLESIVDLIVPVLLHLQESTSAPTMEEDLTSEVAETAANDMITVEASALNADEFREFLARGQDEAET